MDGAASAPGPNCAAARHGVIRVLFYGGLASDLRAAKRPGGGFGLCGRVRRATGSRSRSDGELQRARAGCPPYSSPWMRQWGVTDRWAWIWQTCGWSTTCAAVFLDPGGGVEIARYSIIQCLSSDRGRAGVLSTHNWRRVGGIGRARESERFGGPC